MKLTDSGIEHRAEWQAKGYALPAFDRAAMRAKTKESPRWVQFGTGNLFRAFLLHSADRLLAAGTMESGIVAVKGYDPALLEPVFRAHDNLTLLVTLQNNGAHRKEVLGGMAESLSMEVPSADWERLTQIFQAPSLQLATFTLTEKAYALADASGNFSADVAADFQNGPDKAVSFFGKLAALLWMRFESGAGPLALVSLDNCSHNGDQLKQAILPFAQAWKKSGVVSEAFEKALDNPAVFSFPWTMIDKITPRPDVQIEQMLEADGVEDIAPVTTGKHSCAAAFVNAEPLEYLVVEDAFPNGRPPLEQTGIYFTDRATVERAERMKVCTCLNPLHTALAIFGCLLGYKRMSDAIGDEALHRLVCRIGYREGLPVVEDPKIFDPRTFLDAVVEQRIPNPYLPDTPQRIASDTSQKIPIRFGATLRAWHARPDGSARQVWGILTTLAGWLRYLLAVDDDGNPLTRSPDPMLDALDAVLKPFSFGTVPTLEEAERVLFPLLSDERLFGIDLVQAGWASDVCLQFLSMLKGKGAVRAVLSNLE